jgi:hypothetical protein
VAILAEYNRHLQTAGNQQRLVAKLGGKPAGIDQEHSSRLAAVAAGEHVELCSSSLQQFAQQNHEWGFARASDGEVADADHRSAQRTDRQNSTIV